MQQNYSVPRTLQLLIDLELKLGDPELFYKGLHFYLSPADFRYDATPPDVIVFGHIGVDGIHYGFSTADGLISDLEEAPIVCVCPMDFNQPTRLIAENLRAFLRVNQTDEALFYNEFTNEDSYIAFKKQYVQQLQSPNQRRINSFLENNIDMPMIDSPYLYVKRLTT